MGSITVTVGKNGQVVTKFGTWTRGEQRVIDFTRQVLLTFFLLGVMWVGIQLSDVLGLGTVGILGTFFVIRGFNVGLKIVRKVSSWFKTTSVKPVVKQNQPKPQQNQNPNQNQRPQNNGQQNNRPQFQGNR